MSATAAPTKRLFSATLQTRTVLFEGRGHDEESALLNLADALTAHEKKKHSLRDGWHLKYGEAIVTVINA